MIIRYRRTAFFAALWLISIASLLAEGRSESPRRVVYATDIQNGIQIIGLLGVPLGDLASISARIVLSSSKETEEYIVNFRSFLGGGERISSSETQSIRPNRRELRLARGHFSL
jgi:hypothetical protein